MCAEHKGSLMSRSEETPVEPVDTPQEFTACSAVTRRLLDDRLNDLSEDELARIVVAGGEEGERAALVLSSRFRGIMIRVAENICQQLSHIGIRGLCQRVRCDQAFHSAYTAVLRHALGHDIRTDDQMHDSMIPETSNGAGRARQSACSRWLDRPVKKSDVPLAGWIGQELRQGGRSEDARRQWNKDRQLLQRMSLPPTVKQAWLVRIEELRRATRAAGRPDPFDMFGINIEGSALERIADRLYVDACDCWFTDEPIGFSRVARYLGLVKNRDELTPAIQALIELIDNLIFDASNDDAEANDRTASGSFYERYFVAARQQSRTINHAHIDEALIVADDLDDEVWNMEDEP